MKQCIYKPLPANDSIRVLELLPGLPGQTLEAQLLEVRLSDKPDFCALSYCWGVPKFESLLRCNGTTLHITESLATALECFRDATKTLVIWIDQVCINQKDVAERNAQVQLMRQIYAGASDVLVWLGLTTESSDFMLHSMSSGVVNRADIPRLLCSVGEFCQRQWFERTWTVQEVVLSTREPLFFCGLSSFPWSQFSQLLSTLYQRFSQKNLVPETSLFPSVYAKSINDLDLWKAYLAELNPRRADERMQVSLNMFLDGTLGFMRILGMRVEGSLASFPTQLLRTLHLQVTDGRDKVFGLLGMCTFESDPILPDYGKPIGRVYSEAMAHIILKDFGSGYPSLVLGTSNNAVPSEFPTWVANFMAQTSSQKSATGPMYLVPKLSETINTAVVLASTSAPIAEFSEDFKILYTRGVDLGTVEASFCLPQNSDTELETWKHWFASIVSLVHRRHISIENILECLSQPHSGGYDQWDTALSAFKRMFNLARKGKLSSVAAEEDVWHLLQDFNGAISPGSLDNTVFVTNTRKIGSCTSGVTQGDIVSGLFGINMPFVLRREGDAFSMVGVARVGGYSYSHVTVENSNGECESVDFKPEDLRVFKIV